MPKLLERISGAVEGFKNGRSQPEKPKAEEGEAAWSDPDRLVNWDSAFDISQYNPSVLITRKGMSKIDEMQLDDQVKPSMWLKKRAAISTGYQITSPEGKDRTDSKSKKITKRWEVAEFIDWCFSDGLDRPLPSILEDILDGLDYGFLPAEIVYYTVPRGRWKGKVAIKDIKPRKPHSFDLQADVHGNLVKIRQLQSTGWKDMKPAKFVLFVNEKKWGNWYGRPDLEAAYPWWFIKENLRRWYGKYLECFSIPPLVMQYETDALPPKVVKKLRTIFERLQARTSIQVPSLEGFKVEPITLEQARAIFKDAFQECNQGIARALGLPGLLGFTADQSEGSHARAAVHLDVFMHVLDAIRLTLASDIMEHQVIPRLVDVNFGLQDEYPGFEWNPLTKEKVVELFQAYKEMKEAGGITPQRQDEDWAREMLEAPEKEEEEQKDSDVKVNELFQYHLDFGIVSVNEARKMMGLPPIEGGDKMPVSSAQRAKEEDREETDPDTPTPPPGPGPDGPPQPIPGQPPPAEGEPPPPAPEGPMGFAQTRQANRYERGVNLKGIREFFATTEEGAYEEIQAALEKSRDRLIRQVERQGDDIDHAFINGLSLGYEAELRRAVLTAMEASFHEGRRAVRSEIGRAEGFVAAVHYRPVAALRHLKAKAIEIAVTTHEKVLAQVRKVLLLKLQSDLVTSEAIHRIRDVFVSYLGKPGVIRDGEFLEGWAIDRILRTETTAAFNAGRLVEARDKDLEPFMVGMEYSAILDARVSPVCAHLDGRIFRMDDPALDRFTPPNHVNCRSILVPVTVTNPPEEGDFVTPSQAGRAQELAGKGFA